MKAYFTDVVDNQSVLIEGHTEIPSPEPDEVLIKVKATGLNRGGFIVGGIMHGKKEIPSGTEASGEVISIGSKVNGYKPGDYVMGRVLGTKSGSFAEYSLLKDYQIMPIPNGCTWEEAAAIPVSFLAAYDAVVTYGKLSKDQVMLITSISSAIGVSGLQIGKILEAKIIGTSSSHEKIKKLEKIGMDFGIITPEKDLTNKLREISKSGINLVINCLGGSVFNASMDALAFKGIIVNVGYMDGVDNAYVDLRKIHAQRYSVHGISNAHIQKEDIIQTVNGFKDKILPHLGKDNYKPIIDKIFDFDDIDKAREYMMHNNQVGKIVIKL